MKKSILKLLFVLTMFFVYFFLKNVVMWDAMYVNNSSLSLKENREIKTVVLECIKDWNLSYYNANRDELYQEKLPGYIIYRENSYEKKAFFCIIPHWFMKNMIINNSTYRFIIQDYYPGECFYEIEVRKINGTYKIISFGLV